jgi:hypothetical protein
MTLLMSRDSAAKVIRRTDVDVAVDRQISRIQLSDKTSRLL